MSENFRKYIKKEHYPIQPSVIKFKTLFKNCVVEALRRRTWKEVDQETDWDIYWAEKEWIHEVFDNAHLSQNQRVNHFRNHYELTRKDLMIKNLKRYKKNLEKEGKMEEAASLNFFPTTYNLPSDYSIFFEEFKKSNAMNDKSTWIMKPIGKSQGKGIFLFNKIQQISQWKSSFRYNPENPQAEPYIVQKYILDPLIIGGKKFDMRIYVLCVSYQPLILYLYRTGFARFTHHRYDVEDISNAFVHLTNVAVQKTSENYDEKLGGKWELQNLKVYLLSKYGIEKVSECFNNIQQLIIKSVQSVQKVIINDKHCFELYGFDILFDSSLKPWLLEINASPSMTANTPHDSELKINLLDDVLTIIDMEKILSGQEEQIGGFDLIYKGGPVKTQTNGSYLSLLGAYNNRSQQLKKMAKNIALRLNQEAQDSQLILQGKPSSKESPMASANPNDLLAKKTSFIKNTKIVKTKPTNKIMEKILPVKSVKPVNVQNKLLPSSSNSTQSTQSKTSSIKSNAFQQNVINNLNNQKKNNNPADKPKNQLDHKEEGKNNIDENKNEKYVSSFQNVYRSKISEHEKNGKEEEEEE